MALLNISTFALERIFRFMLTTLLQQTTIITIFVLGMMLVIEYINIQTRGLWTNMIQKSPFTQIFIGTMLGLIPGCLGSYTMVSLYVHRVVMFPALVANMLATSGDEAYIMFSLIPSMAIKLHVLLFFLAMLTGIVVHFTVKNKYIGLKEKAHFPIHHKNEECNHYHPSLIIDNLKNLSFTRALLITGVVSLIVVFLSGIIDGSHDLHTLMGGTADPHHAEEAGHDHAGEADWIRISLVSLLTVILYIILTVKEHFLFDHLWNHIIKKHFHKIFLWTFTVLLVIHFLNEYVDLEYWISENLFVVLLMAVLIGIIPESGPHYIFVLLFAQGVLPFSILAASSIVQDGHGMLPLLAESRKGFFAVKLVNIIVGLLVGISGILLGF